MQEFDLIETPENVLLEQRLAGIGSRFIAGLVDNILIAGLFAVLLLIFVLVTWVNPLAFFDLSGGTSANMWFLALTIRAA